jgi:hypothetical protein
MSMIFNNITKSVKKQYLTAAAGEKMAPAA